MPVADQRLAATSAEAVAAAEAVGYPMVVKVSSPDITHKTEVGGVVPGCLDADAVARAARQVVASAVAAMPAAVIEGVTVTRVIDPVLELISGIHRDSTFGPVVLLGLGGIWAEVPGDVTMRGLPLGPDEAERMVDDLQGAPLLRGARGRKPVSAEALVRLVHALARIVGDDGDRLRGIDMNPVAVSADSELVVLDAAVYTNDDKE